VNELHEQFPAGTATMSPACAFEIALCTAEELQFAALIVAAKDGCPTTAVRNNATAVEILKNFGLILSISSHIVHLCSH
jgi:hypothetical protein